MSRVPVSQLFATSKAPYIKYLEKIKDRWVDAAVLEKSLKSLTPVVERYNKPVSPNRKSKEDRAVTVAELLDIQSDANGNHNTLKAPIHSLAAYSNHTMPEPAAIDNFLHRLQRCEPNVHTRIVVLHSGRFLSGDRAVDSLFFCHVLGIELDLCPTDVCDLAQLDNHRDGWAPTDMQPRQRLPMKPGFVSLAFSKETRKRSVAAYIGRRQMGQSAPHVVVVRLQDDGFCSQHLRWASVGGILEAPTPSGNLIGCPVPATAVVFFRNAVRRCLLSERPLNPEDLTGSWLSALIYMDAVKSAESLDDLISEWQAAGNKLNTEELHGFSESVGKLCNSLQTSVNQVAAFRKSFPSARYSEYGEAYHFLNRLLGDAKPIAQEVQDEINTQSQKINYEVSLIAVKESKSAIALTVLAFIFIPINTASSIFGMNVKEIGESASIWAFVIIACALTACSGLGWFLWHAPWRRWGRSVRADLKIPVSQKKREKLNLECRV